jgi:hypothetical protein
MAMTALTGGQSGSCADSSCGPVFNSQTNSADYGGMDESQFFRVKNASSPQPGFTNGTIDIDGDAVLMQAFISTQSGAQAATGTTLTITLPTGSAFTQTATATLSAVNASSISDSVSMRDSQPFSLAFDQTAPVYVAHRANNGTGDYVNVATNDFSISGNVMTVRLGNWGSAAGDQGVVTVRVKVMPGQTTAFACTNLQRTSIDNNRSTLTANTNGQAAGANVSSYTFTVRDSGNRVVDTRSVNTTAQTANYDFNQTNPGTYTVSAVANSDKGSTAGSTSCSQRITVSAPAVVAAANTTANTPSAAIPNTGAGDVLGIFSGAGLVGSAGHYIYRRYRR